LEPNRAGSQEIRNSNIEIRNKSEIQKFKNNKQGNDSNLIFEFGRFEFLSKFGFRASDLDPLIWVAFAAILRTILLL